MLKQTRHLPHRRTTARQTRWLPAALLALAACSPLAAQVNGTWATNANSNWSALGTWSDGEVPGGVGSIITVDRTQMASNRTLTVNNADRTVGQIIGTGSGADTRNAIIAASGGYKLILDNGSSAARITNTGLGHLTVSAPVSLMGNLELTNENTSSGGNYMTLSGGVSAGSAGLKTITTMASSHTPADPNYHRIVFQNTSISDGAGQIAVIHNSGNNLNFQNVTNTATGGLFLNSGVLRLTNIENADVSLGAADAAVTFNGGTLSFFSASASATTSNRLTTLNAAGGTIDVANGGTVVWNGDVVGAGSLTKTGAGSLTFTKVNAFSGGTSITGGTLVAANDSALGTGSVHVGAATFTLSSGVSLANNITLANNAKLTASGEATLLGRVDGIGTIGNADGALVFGAGSVLSPGNSAGILSIGGVVTLQAGSVYQWELASLASAVAGADFDQILVGEGGVLNIANGAMLDLVFGNNLAPDAGDAFWSQNHTWTIVAGTGSVSGGVFEIDNSAWASLGLFNTSLVDGSVALNWTAAAIPEPSTYAAIFGGLALVGVVLIRRRRRQATDVTVQE